MSCDAPRWRSRLRAAALGGALAALAGCSLAPPYQPPPAPAPGPAYKEAGDWLQARPADAAPRGNWWSVFGDAQLDTLEGQAAAGNQDLKAAFARLVQARDAARVARAAYYPQLTLGADPTRQRQSSNAPKFSHQFAQVYSDYSLSADFSYELDVWGRVRNAASSARAQAQASAADLAALDLAIRAELAADYFMLCGDDAQQLLLDRTVVDYARALQLTQNLYDGGAAALTDVAQARAQLETARTQAEDVRLRRAQLEHAIAVLTGNPPSAFRLEPKPLSASPPPLDPGLPSALLERRPDVAAAERRVASANAQIGVARAAYFPQFSLSASAGFEGSTASNWLEAPSRTWSLGPSALLTVFDAGRISALSDQARAAYDETVADYRSSVLGAYQDVEDNLAALRQLERESLSEADAVAATRKVLEQATLRYKAGAASYLEVVTAENAALAAQQSQVDIQTRRMSAAVLLVKALGGGWHGAALQQSMNRTGPPQGNATH
ncbi:MAG: efflux transporter outer membrane subunit [Nevskia sp.]|nr:efflux transporter outer membrane subunit [Nevskia sp.]